MVLGPTLLQPTLAMARRLLEQLERVAIVLVWGGGRQYLGCRGEPDLCLQQPLLRSSSGADDSRGAAADLRLLTAHPAGECRTVAVRLSAGPDDGQRHFGSHH